MANEIKLKRGSGSDPTASDLAVGEVAIRTDNGKLFTKKDNGSVAEITGGGGIDDGDKGDITVSNSGATFTIDNGVVNNAKISGSANIAGTKISPDFGSQNIETLGSITAPVLVAQGASGSGDAIIHLLSGGGQNNDFSRIRQDISDDSFLIENKSSGSYESFFKGNSSRGAELHFQGNKKLETVSTGITVTGSITATGGGLTTNGDVQFNSGTTNANILFDASDMALEFDDNVKATFGFDADLKIHHNGTSNFFDSANGAIVFRTAGNDNQIFMNPNGSVELYHNGNKKFETSNTGGTITGTLVATAFTGALTGNVTGNVSGSSGSCTGNSATATALANARTIAGVSFDGTSNISLNNNAITNGAGYITGSGNAATATKLATARTIAGVSFDGSANISLNNNSITNGAGYITSADGGNAATLDGIDSSQFLRSDASDTMTGTLTIGNGSAQTELHIKKADNNVSDHLQFYNGTTRVGEIGVEDTSWLRINQETNANIYTPRYIRADNGFFVDGTSKGINGSGNFIGGTIAGASDYSTLLRSNAADTASGDITFSGGAGAVSIAANSDIRFTNGNWTGNVNGTAKIQHHSNYLYISGGTNGIIFRENNSDRWVIDGSGHFDPGTDSTYDIGQSNKRVRNGYFDTLYGDGSNLTGISGGLSTSGGTLTGTLNARAIVPTANNTYALGTASARWSDVFTADFHLSNKGSSNQVDNTWGDFTIQEGKDDLFLLNNRNGKMYKFMLKEVS